MPAATSADTTISPQSAAPKHSKTKRVLIGLVAVIVALGAAYGGGRLQTAMLIRDAESHAAQIEQKRQAVLGELAAERQKVKRLDARRHLHLAILALDERNFGIAQNELATTAKLLTDSAPSPNDPFAKVSADLSKQKLLATEDLSVQRQKLLGWARALDSAWH